MKLEVIDNESDFVELRGDWNQLTGEPLLSWDWNYWAWKYLGQANRLCIITTIKNGVIQGIAPFMLESRSGEHCLRFLASGTACTDYPQLVCRPETRIETIELVANAICSKDGPLTNVSLVELEAVRETDQISCLLNRLGKRFWSYQKTLESSWILDLPSSWEQFVARKHKSLRRKICKAEKRLTSGEAIVRSTKENLDFETAFGILIDLHQRRLVSKGKVGVFSNQQFARFLNKATQSLAQRNMAEIAVVEVHGRPIVAHLYLNTPTGLQTYQSGICDMSMHYEPGHLLFTHTIRKAIDAGQSSFDFLRGDEPYKKFWGATPIPLYTVRCVSNRLPNNFKHQVIRGLRQVKALVKQSMNFENRNGTTAT